MQNLTPADDFLEQSEQQAKSVIAQRQAQEKELQASGLRESLGNIETLEAFSASMRNAFADLVQAAGGAMQMTPIQAVQEAGKGLEIEAETLRQVLGEGIDLSGASIGMTGDVINDLYEKPVEALAYYVPRTVTTSLPAVAAGALAAPLGAAAAVGTATGVASLQGMGQVYLEQKKKTGDEDLAANQALAYAAGSGLVNLGGFAAALKLFGPQVGQNIVKTAALYSAGVLSSGATEALDQVVQNVVTDNPALQGTMDAFVLGAIADSVTNFGLGHLATLPPSQSRDPDPNPNIRNAIDSAKGAKTPEQTAAETYQVEQKPTYDDEAYKLILESQKLIDEVSSEIATVEQDIPDVVKPGEATPLFEQTRPDPVAKAERQRRSKRQQKIDEAAQQEMEQGPRALQDDISGDQGRAYRKSKNKEQIFDFEAPDDGVISMFPLAETATGDLETRFSTEYLTGIVNELAETLGVRVFQGGLNWGTLGSFNRQTGAIQVANLKFLDTVGHEVTHKLDQEFQIINKVLAGEAADTDAVIRELNDLGQTYPDFEFLDGVTQLREGLARYAESRIARPQKTAELYPELTFLFESSVPNNVLAALDTFSNKYRQHIFASGADKTLARVANRFYQPQGLAGFKARFQKWRETLRKADEGDTVLQRIARATTPVLDFAETVWTNFFNSRRPAFKAARFLSDLPTATEVTKAIEDSFEYWVSVIPNTMAAVEAAFEFGFPGLTENKPKTSGSIKDLLELAVGKTYEDKLLDVDKFISYGISLRVIEQVDIQADIEANRYMNAYLEENPEFKAEVEAIAENPDNITLEDIYATDEKIAAEIEDGMDAERENTKRQMLVSGAGDITQGDYATAQQTISELEQNSLAEDMERYREMFRIYQSNSNAMMDMAQQAGLISEETRQAIREKNQFYFAFNRIDEVSDAELGPQLARIGSSRDVTTPSQPIRGRKGSEKPLENPIVSIMRNMEAIVLASRKNMAKRAMIDLVETQAVGDPNPQAWQVARRVASPDTGNVISHWENGELVHVSYTDRDVYEAMKLANANPIIADALKPLVIASDIFRKTITLAPKFVFNQKLRAIENQLIFSPSDALVDLDSLKTLGTSADPRKNPAAVEAIFAGVSFGIGHTLDSNNWISSMKKVLQKTSKDNTVLGRFKALPAEAWEKWTRYEQETGQREFIAQYTAAKKKFLENGMSEEAAQRAAVLESKRLIDFHASGAYMASIKRLHVFANAAFQDTRAKLKGLKRNYEQGRLPLVAARWALFGALPVMLTRIVNGLNGRNEEYEQLPWYWRDLFNCVFVGDIMIPIPRNYFTGVASAAVDRTISAMVGQERAFQDFASGAASQLIPFSAETFLLQGPAEALKIIFANRRFPDVPVVREEERKKNLELREGAQSASPLGKGISSVAQATVNLGQTLDPEAVDSFTREYLDPRTIDALIEAQLGYLGKSAVSLSQGDFTKASETLLPYRTLNQWGRDVSWLITEAQAKGLTREPWYRDLWDRINQYNDAPKDSRRALRTDLWRFARDIRRDIETQK